MNVDISSLRGLPVDDKLQLVTELWNDIAASPTPPVLPPEVIDEASRRSAELRDNPELAIDDEELWRRVDG